MQEGAKPGNVRKWVILTLVAVLGMAGVTAYVAIQTEESVKKKFEFNLSEVYRWYANYEAAMAGPAKTPEEFLKWLATVDPPQPAAEKMVTSGRARVAWGEKLREGQGAHEVFAYTTDPPVRGRRPVVTLDGAVRWLTQEEFNAAEKAGDLK